MTGLMGGYPLGHFIEIPRACDHCRQLQGHAPTCITRLEEQMRRLTDATGEQRD